MADANQEQPSAAEWPEGITEGVNHVRSEIQRLDRELRALVKERPFLALVGAVATGYLAGRVLARR